MYIARKNSKGRLHFFIRQSVRKDETFISRDLFDLGQNPGRFIVYPGGNAYYVHEDVEDSLRNKGVSPDPFALEDIFWPFVSPDIRAVLSGARTHEKSVKNSKRKKLTPEDAQAIHIFDKRRIHYLKCGRIDIGQIRRVSPSLFRPVFEKSRDEIEQKFMDMEDDLSPREAKSYVYSIFNLQKHFSERTAKVMPQALDPGKIDEHFMEEICKLNQDTHFFSGMKTGNNLHPYFVRYLIMFFDHDFQTGAFMRDYMHHFNQYRARGRSKPASPKPTSSQVNEIFGKSMEVLQKMTKNELTSLYRKLARKHHPDTGGDPGKFIRLRETYEYLSSRHFSSNKRD